MQIWLDVDSQTNILPQREMFPLKTFCRRSGSKQETGVIRETEGERAGDEGREYGIGFNGTLRTQAASAAMPPGDI